LPTAYVGRTDADSAVAALWKEVWEEGSAAVTSREIDVALQEQLLERIVGGCLRALGDVSWSRRAAAGKGIEELARLDVLAPLPKASTGKKAVEERAKRRTERRARASLQILHAGVPVLAKGRIWTGKSDFLKAIVKVATNWTPCLYDNEHLTSSEIKPLSMQTEHALFAGDGWFAHEKETLSKEDRLQDYAPEDATMMGNASEKETPSKEVTLQESSPQDAMMTGTASPEVHEDAVSETKGDTAGPPPRESPAAPLPSSLLFSGFCRLLLLQGLATNMAPSASGPEHLLYRVSALTGLKDLLQALSKAVQEKEDHTLMATYGKFVYATLAPKLTDVILSHTPKVGGSLADSKTQCHEPVIIARAIDCLSAAFWTGLGEEMEMEASPPDLQLHHANLSFLVPLLTKKIHSAATAWTIRESAAAACGRLAILAPIDLVSRRAVLAPLVEAAATAAEDSKYWRVRVAGLGILAHLAERTVIGRREGVQDALRQRQPVRAAGLGILARLAEQTADRVEGVRNGPRERQQMLEALLPQKERIVTMARRALRDKEPKVTAVATGICASVVGWP